MATIELHQVEKKFGEVFAVKPMDLTVNNGEFVALLGPSGCGKTTTLRMMSGLEAVTAGKITLDGKNITWLKPADRNVAFVFQFYALYPHISVHDNIAFPLRAEGMARAEMDKRVAEVVEMLQIGHLLKLRPGKLSGGDKQRVALARALVRRPAAFLMDEPLGALDAEFRETMRAEIKRLHISQHATTVYVTHDQVEAMAMADRIVVMSAAEVQQIGTPAAVYYDPANLFVARFIGSPGMNLVTGRLAGDGVQMPGPNNKVPVPAAQLEAVRRVVGGDGEVVIGFRPEAASLSTSGKLSGEVYATDMHGSYKLLHATMNESDIIHIRADRLANYPIGAPVHFDIEPAMVRFFHPTTQQAIGQEAGR